MTEFDYQKLKISHRSSEKVARPFVYFDDLINTH